VIWREADISEEHIMYIFRVEEYAKQETSKISLPPASAGWILSLLFNSAIFSSGTSGHLRATQCYDPEESMELVM
jgi:hypothetical protein